MFDAPYPYCLIGKESTPNDIPSKIHIYKFQARHRSYLVILEIYDFGIVAIKYCDRRDKGSKNAYNKVYNDKNSDANKIITTCLFIMREYWRQNPNANFSFHGALRFAEDDILKRRKIEKNSAKIEEYKRVRFSIYKYAMYNLFSPKDFEHSFDAGNSIYLLINKKEKKPQKVKKELENFLSNNFAILFDDTPAQD